MYTYTMIYMLTFSYPEIKHAAAWTVASSYTISFRLHHYVHFGTMNNFGDKFVSLRNTQLGLTVMHKQRVFYRYCIFSPLD